MRPEGASRGRVPLKHLPLVPQPGLERDDPDPVHTGAFHDRDIRCPLRHRLSPFRMTPNVLAGVDAASAPDLESGLRLAQCIVMAPERERPAIQ